MLISVPLDTIFDQEEPTTIFDWDCLYGEKETVDEDIVRNIILNNLNIQIALAEIIPFQENMKKMGINEKEISVQSSVGFSNDIPTNEQIENVRLIFDKFFLVSKNNIVIACQVLSPFEKVVQVFLDLCNENQLNKWVSLFYLRKSIQDCSDIACYQYLSEENEEEQISIADIQKDEFFKYIFYSKRNDFVQKCIPISSFAMQEIDTDPYIKTISRVVKNLYVYISRDEFNGEIIYSKFLTWNENVV